MSIEQVLAEYAVNGRFSRFDSISDEDITKLVQDGDSGALEYLLYKYKNFVRARARAYFLVGADREDIIQEGMIGFFKAVRDYRKDKSTSFHVFAELCITRQIITAIKTATRQKHIPLNSYVSLNKPVFDEDSERTMIDVVSVECASSPEDLLLDREKRDYLEQKMNESLSDLEWDVLNSYLQDRSYQEIAHDLSRHVKSVDNALQRVKRKMEKMMEDA
jgi:RNA polymerase sporulation-specific sigma factor